eukprot:413362-Heterocapsa_arctica.AAC.1
MLACGRNPDASFDTLFGGSALARAAANDGVHCTIAAVYCARGRLSHHRWACPLQNADVVLCQGEMEPPLMI